MMGLQMSKYREKIDDIFKSLYGASIDENKESYKDVYYYESLGMENDYHEYLKCMDLTNLLVAADEITRFIVYTEYNHIGNNHLVRCNLDLRKLEEVVTELLEG